MPEPAVVTAMREFKRGLLQREAGQMQAMARRWLGVETALSAEIEALTFDFDQRRRDGETISRAALYRQERYKRLLVQTNEQFAQYAGWAEGQVRDGQQTMGRLGLEHGAQAIEMSYWDGQTVAPVFDRLPVEAIERMVGIAGNGAPLGELLKQRIAPGYGDGQAASVWQRLTQTLVDSTALGRNPRKTARLMRDALAGGLNKALVIARTEQLRVYRQASVDQYRASGVVRGQKRLTAHDDRVCAACIADEGTVYSLEATIPDHPQGRCTSVPIVDGMPEISWLSGEAWFRTQPEGVQRSILGPGKLAAWQDGQFDFGALATPTYDDTWGGGLRPTSLADLLRGTGNAPSPLSSSTGPARTISAQERMAAGELAEAREVYEAMLAAGDEAGAEGIKSYMDTLEQSLQQEQRLNTELWNTLGITPDQATADDWRMVASQVEREGYELYKRYTKEGIRAHVAEERGAQASHYQSVGKEVVLVREGRFSRRAARRMEGELWSQAKEDLGREAGVLLQRMGYSAQDIAQASYEQRMRLLDELGKKQLLRTGSGRISKIDKVPEATRTQVTGALDYDAAAVCAGVQGDPLNLPTLDGWGLLELADIIRTTRMGQ